MCERAYVNGNRVREGKTNMEWMHGRDYHNEPQRCCMLFCLPPNMDILGIIADDAHTCIPSRYMSNLCMLALSANKVTLLCRTY
jgi:hypothetical protein